MYKSVFELTDDERDRTWWDDWRRHEPKHFILCQGKERQCFVSREVRDENRRYYPELRAS